MNKYLKNNIPLIVDLDGTLVKSDLLIESFFHLVGKDFKGALHTTMFLRNGKACLKAIIASKAPTDPSLLPYDKYVLDLIREAKAELRPVYLATASHRIHADAVANFLSLFDGVFATDNGHNLAGSNKARMLVEAFGEAGFDYVGNDACDLSVWQHARQCYAVRTSGSVRRQAAERGIALRVLEASSSQRLPIWLKAIRVHQYVKNCLVAVPMITSHSYDAINVMLTVVVFLSFSAAASAVYILNDLIDIDADRRHPTKCNRPIACGAIALKPAIGAMIVLLTGSIIFAALISIKFLAVIIIYLALTTAYSLYLKRKLLIDVVTLAMLYTIRVIAGGVALDIMLSEWLLTFSLFVFTSLALIKRYVELAVRINGGLDDPNNRDYRRSDLTVVGSLAAGTGMNAIVVFTLYLSSQSVLALYREPKILWFICPLLIYLLGRMLLVAQRCEMHDDPIVYALRDRVSRIAIVLIVAIVIAAKYCKF